MNPDILAQVRAIVCGCAKVAEDSLSPDQDLIDCGAVDSLTALQIINRLERKFDVMIPEEDLPKYVTLNAIAAGIVTLRRT